MKALLHNFSLRSFQSWKLKPMITKMLNTLINLEMQLDFECLRELLIASKQYIVYEFINSSFALWVTSLNPDTSSSRASQIFSNSDFSNAKQTGMFKTIVKPKQAHFFTNFTTRTVPKKILWLRSLPRKGKSATPKFKMLYFFTSPTRCYTFSVSSN